VNKAKLAPVVAIHPVLPSSLCNLYFFNSHNLQSEWHTVTQANLVKLNLTLPPCFTGSTLKKYCCLLVCVRVIMFTQLCIVHLRPFLFQISMFCHAGPQHLSYLNDCHLPSLSPFHTDYLYIFKTFYQHIFLSLTFIFYPPYFNPAYSFRVPRYQIAARLPNVLSGKNSCISHIDF
jgi:hypothetical protein